MTRLKRPGHYLIGLTGNIAVGKSTVLELLRARGARTIDADQAAHEVMATPAMRDALEQAFGPAILDARGGIDRGALGHIVFRDPAALAALEAIVHPAVGRVIEAAIAQAREPVIVIEAIKLIEAGLHHGYDALWVVTAAPEQQAARLMETRGLTSAEAWLRIDAQPPQSAKAALANVVIVNQGERADLEQQVCVAWEHIQEELSHSGG